MASIIQSLAKSAQAVVVIDIGQAYTKYGFAGNVTPYQILSTDITIDGKKEPIFEYNSNSLILHKDRLLSFIQSLFYKWNTVNTRGRRIVLIESIVTPTHIRKILADIFLKTLEVSSLAFIPSHLAAIFTLGCRTALVLDVGYREAQIIPVVENVPLAVLFDSVSYASQAVHQRIQLLLEEHATITRKGKQRTFRSTDIKLSENILEDIKVRCCFVSPFNRAQTFAKNQLFGAQENDSFQEVSVINYPLDTDKILHIPGRVREFSCEVLFEQDIDGRSIATLILDSLLQSSIDVRRQLADNILIMGGTAMMPGFLHRFNSELMHLVNTPPYVNKLAIKQFRFHAPPAQLNYTAWLGGSIFGSLDLLEPQSIVRKEYLENGRLPDWFSDEMID